MDTGKRGRGGGGGGERKKDDATPCHFFSAQFDRRVTLVLQLLITWASAGHQPCGHSRQDEGKEEERGREREGKRGRKGEKKGGERFFIPSNLLVVACALRSVPASQLAHADGGGEVLFLKGVAEGGGKRRRKRGGKGEGRRKGEKAAISSLLHYVLYDRNIACVAINYGEEPFLTRQRERREKKGEKKGKGEKEEKKRKGFAPACGAALNLFAFHWLG